ncbi:hypothetical protein, partial [Devosia yakushimensis]|uniref:hypothetical protein n=1 Tax=Devosia yakushimensis TaxID=470028 RepID=UPI0024E12C87
EPRRPRFSFFILHNVKKQTQPPSRQQRHLEARLPYLLLGKTSSVFRLPGSQSALSENAEQWEQQVLDVVSVGGL